jgi:ElaB/YqjD/DUF883 family membrane-anchored ribosome-binding protein
MATMPNKDTVLKSVDSMREGTESLKDGVMDRAAAAVDSVKEGVRDRAAAAVDTAQREAAELQDTVTRGAAKVADTVSTKLKAAGVDTDVMVSAAKEQATELQRLIAEELKSRPFRALGVAAAFGLIVGLLSSR